MNNRKLEVTLETVTPLFLGGADGSPELRPPPFRGAMRYWFRAMAGGIVGDSDAALKELSRKEAKIFGSPDEKTGGQSAVWVRLSTPPFKSKREPLLPHKNKPRIPAIPQNTSLVLTLTLKPGAEIQHLELAIWSLLLGLTLGGLGKRSRRGFGSLRIKSIASTPEAFSSRLITCLTEAAAPAADAAALTVRIRNLLASARTAFETSFGSQTQTFRQTPKFSLLKPDTRILVWTPPANSSGSYQSVLSPLMNKLSDLMHDNIKWKFAQAFGTHNPRRASPLWVSTHRLQNDGWALVLTYLQAEYLSNKQGDQQQVHQLATNFLNSPPTGWAKTEVQP